MGQDVVEKRRFNRIEFREPVQVSPILPSKSANIYEVQDNRFEAQATDISEGGLRLEVPRPFTPHLLLKLKFEMSKDQPIEVFAKIVWSEKRFCGVSFIAVDEFMQKSIRAIFAKKAQA